MLDKIFDILDPSPKDELDERVRREKIYAKYGMLMGAALLFSVVSALVAVLAMWKHKLPPYPPVISIIQKTGEKQRIQTLPYPHQSFRNLQNWVVDAVSAAYSFEFHNFDKQVEEASYYFTPDGYRSYRNALEISGVEKQVKEKQILVTLVPLREPVQLRFGGYGENLYWMVRVPVLVTYTGGKKPYASEHTIDLLIVRTPPHLNHKGMAIAKFTMN